MKKRYGRISLCFVLMVIILVMSAGVIHAASWKTTQWTYDEYSGTGLVKAGKIWIKSDYVRNDNADTSIYQISKSAKKKSGYKVLISGKNLNSGFAADGKTIYYLEKNVLKSYTIRTGKIKKVKKLSKPTQTCYFNFSGYYGGKIWFLCRDEKFICHYLMSFDPVTMKFKKQLQNVRVYNAVEDSRYVPYTDLKVSKTGQYKNLCVYDKKTGESVKVAKSVLPWGYASGGTEGAASGMRKWFIYGQYDKQKKTWSIVQYTFETGKYDTLLKLKKGKVLTGLMYTGKGVRYTLKGDPQDLPWDANRVDAK